MSTKSQYHDRDVTAIISFDIHKREKNSTSDDYKEIENTKNYALNDFTETDQKIIFDAIETKMRDYVTFCKEENDKEDYIYRYTDSYDRYFNNNDRFNSEEHDYDDYCNGVGYAKSRIKSNNVKRKGCKIYINFESCNPKKINHQMTMELMEGYFSDCIKEVILSDGEYILTSQLNSWEGGYGIIFTKQFEKNLISLE